MATSIERIRSILSGQYTVIEELGRGGMAVVYLARDLKHDRDVALKVLDPDSASTIESKRFDREIRIAAGLTHAHIVPIHDSGRADGLIYYVMPRVRGETLQERLERVGRLPVPDVLGLALDVASALDHAHARDVVHRDIKPGNVFLTDGGALVADFGIAVALGDAFDTPSDARMTGSGVLMGTPAYMSPEQLTDPEAVDWRTDVFSFGAVLFECLAGHRPFSGGNQRAHPILRLSGEPGPLPAECPGPLADLVRGFLAVDPADRLRERGALRRSCEAVAERISTREGAERAARSRRWALGATTALVAVALALVVALGQRDVDAGLPPVGLHEPVVTWASRETDARMTPGGEISFLSDRDGVWAVWTVSSGSEPVRRITGEEGRIDSHAWSPDGRRLAYVITSGGGRFLQISDAEGTVQASHRLPGGRDDPVVPELVRWLDDVLYLLLDGELWSLDVDVGTLEHRFGGGGRPVLLSADVRTDGRRIVYSAMGGEAPDLWVADVDGSHSERLTDDPHIRHKPCWLGPDGDAIAFLSNEGGQRDIWRMRLSDRRMSAVTAGFGGVVQVGCAVDGSALVVGRDEERADLWMWTPDGEVQLTSDSRADLMPSSAGDRVVFQRARPRLDLGHPLFDASVLEAVRDGDSLRDVRVLAENGFAPEISPDGERVAYLRYPSAAGGTMSELRVTDRSGDWLVTDRFRTPIFRFRPPLDWEADNLAWSPDGDELHFVAVTAGGEGRSLVGRARVTPDGPVVDTLISFARDAVPQDLARSPSGDRLAYLVHLPVRGVRELRVLELESGEERTVYRESVAEDLYVAGWEAGEGSVVVVRALGSAAAATPIEPLIVSLDGVVTELVGLTDAVGAQARLDHARSALVVPTLDADGVSLHRLSLSPGSEWSRTMGASSYSAFELASDGGVLYVRHEMNSDVWKVVFSDVH